MEVLNAAVVKPISLHREKRRAEHKKLSPFQSQKYSFSFGNLKFPSLGLGALSTALLNNGLAKSLTYEEALGQTVGADDSLSLSSSIDITQLLDTISKFTTENALIVGGGALALFVPLILSQLLQKPKSWGVISAKSAYTKLSEESETQLLDIREGKDFKTVGSPDIKATKKKAVSITYRGDDKPGFLKKLALKFKDPASTTLFILDKFDGNSELVAELVTVNGFKSAYAIKDGAEGIRGWMNSGLPWSEPKKGLSLDFGGLTDAISGVFGESSDGLPVTLGLAAATGLGALAFSEIETILQLLGSAAIVQFVTKKFLFAEDRKETLQQVDEFLNTKVAPKELVDEIKMIGNALLPGSSSTKSLPVAATSAPAPVEKTETVVEIKTEIKEETVQLNSTPEAEAEKESSPVIPRPLSPYPFYPDFKPPSSPSPSQP